MATYRVRYLSLLIPCFALCACSAPFEWSELPGKATGTSSGTSSGTSTSGASTGGQGSTTLDLSTGPDLSSSSGTATGRTGVSWDTTGCPTSSGTGTGTTGTGTGTGTYDVEVEIETVGDCLDPQTVEGATKVEAKVLAERLRGMAPFALQDTEVHNQADYEALVETVNAQNLPAWSDLPYPHVMVINAAGDGVGGCYPGADKPVFFRHKGQLHVDWSYGVFTSVFAESMGGWVVCPALARPYVVFSYPVLGDDASIKVCKRSITTRPKRSR